MEADFKRLRRDVKLTSNPKKVALELLRRKIEASVVHATHPALAHAHAPAGVE